MANNGVFTLLMFLMFFFAGSFLTISANNFNQNVDLIWGGDRANIRQGGRALSLTLDQVSGSGFQSKSAYLFGRVDMEIMLVPGNSAGTVTAYYVSLFQLIYLTKISCKLNINFNIDFVAVIFRRTIP